MRSPKHRESKVIVFSTYDIFRTSKSLYHRKLWEDAGKEEGKVAEPHQWTQIFTESEPMKSKLLKFIEIKTDAIAIRFWRQWAFKWSKSGPISFMVPGVRVYIKAPKVIGERFFIHLSSGRWKSFIHVNGRLRQVVS